MKWYANRISLDIWIDRMNEGEREKDHIADRLAQLFLGFGPQNERKVILEQIYIAIGESCHIPSQLYFILTSVGDHISPVENIQMFMYMLTFSFQFCLAQIITLSVCLNCVHIYKSVNTNISDSRKTLAQSSNL